MRNRGIITWIALIVGILLLLNLPAPVSLWVKSALRETVAPLQQVITVFTLRFKEASTVFRGLGGIVRENREMAEELVRLRHEMRTLEALQNENIDLRVQLGFRENARRPLVACEVIGRDISGWWQTIRLGKGMVNGVETGAAVITSEGLVGKVIDASARTSDVLLISDPTCKVSARISRTEAFGIVSGRGVSWDGQAGCAIDFIDKNVPVRVGDEVITSGLGGVFPKGLLIGYVERVYRDRSGLYQYAYLIPKADLGRLFYVFVMGVTTAMETTTFEEEGVP